MNYDCDPDLNPAAQHLTVDAVSLFQRFKQDADVKTVEGLLDQELGRYIKLCELAILHAANATIYWAVLPKHPIQDFEIWANRHLEEMGFEVEYTRIASKESVPSADDPKKKIDAVVVRSCFTAKWFLAKPLDPDRVSSEWRRREALEDIDLVASPPKPQSRALGDDFEQGDAVWAAILDDKYIVEIQRINHRSYLCLFEVGGKFLHAETTNVSYGAPFGPDISDVEQWSRRAQEIVNGRPAGSDGDDRMSPPV